MEKRKYASPDQARAETKKFLRNKFFEKNNQEVITRLNEWKFGEAINFLTPEGLDRNRYYPFARRELNLYDGATRIGEVPLPENFHKFINDWVFFTISANFGYGHKRPEQYFRNLVELFGAHCESVFLGGPADVLKTILPNLASWLKGHPEKMKLDQLLRDMLMLYHETSVEDGKKHGMVPQDYEIEKENRLSKQDKEGILNILEYSGAKPGIKKNPSLIREVFTGKDVDTKETIDKQALALDLIFGYASRGLIKDIKKRHPNKKLGIISTFPLVSRHLGRLKGKTRKMIDAIVNIGTDAVQALQIYMWGLVPTYLEAPEAINKLKKRAMLEELEDTYATGGFPSPLSVFKRNGLSQKRTENLKKGVPLTIVGTASGIAPAQEESFVNFMQMSVGKIKKGELRMIFQCGAEEGGAIHVYNRLLNEAKLLGIEDKVVLHVGKDPQAALDFFEALSWSETPMALLVKGSEMARIAYSLNIPLIPTGAIGDHEIWNLVLALRGQPGFVNFLPEVAEALKENIKDTWKDDEEVKQTEGLYEETIKLINKHTAKTDIIGYSSEQLIKMQYETQLSLRDLVPLNDLFEKVVSYILSGNITKTNNGSMLRVVMNMIAPKQP